jgi:hypothetical protein
VGDGRRTGHNRLLESLRETPANVARVAGIIAKIEAVEPWDDDVASAILADLRR